MNLVKQLAPADADAVARLHTLAFRNFFLSRLGFRFLRSFYGALIRRNDTICAGCWEGNTLTGFYVANHDHRGFYPDLGRKNFVPFVMSSIPAFLKNPLLIFRLMKSFQSNNKSSQFDHYPYLMSICVAPDQQNKGLGKIMIDDLLLRLQAKGFKGLTLTTDAADNEATNKFYLRSGFEDKARFFQGKREMVLYFRGIN
jgi:ribosomal protein S18 acetylase RimI-like enzyme